MQLTTSDSFNDMPNQGSTQKIAKYEAAETSGNRKQLVESTRNTSTVKSKNHGFLSPDG